MTSLRHNLTNPITLLIVEISSRNFERLWIGLDRGETFGEIKICHFDDLKTSLHYTLANLERDEISPSSVKGSVLGSV